MGARTFAQRPTPAAILLVALVALSDAETAQNVRRQSQTSASGRRLAQTRLVLDRWGDWVSVPLAPPPPRSASDDPPPSDADDGGGWRAAAAVVDQGSSVYARVDGVDDKKVDPGPERPEGGDEHRGETTSPSSEKTAATHAEASDERLTNRAPEPSSRGVSTREAVHVRVRRERTSERWCAGHDDALSGLRQDLQPWILRKSGLTADAEAQRAALDDEAYADAVGVIVHRGETYVYPRDRVERLVKHRWKGVMDEIRDVARRLGPEADGVEFFVHHGQGAERSRGARFAPFVRGESFHLLSRLLPLSDDAALSRAPGEASSSET